MKNSFGTRISIAALTLSLASCGDSVAGNDGAERLYGTWQKLEESLPPVKLTVRREGSATVGQVWLSGVTYTLPATLDDSSLFLADPASSALAPFVAVLQKNGTLRATLRAQPDYVTTLHKIN